MRKEIAASISLRTSSSFWAFRRRRRKYYLIWEEGKAPDVVIELTSKSTKREDQVKKRDLYRDVLRVPEYFLFDPTEDYLKPPLQGFRLEGDEYIRIEPIEGRLPSEILGLHLERDRKELRLYDPETRLSAADAAGTRGRVEARSGDCQARSRDGQTRSGDVQARSGDVQTRSGDGQARSGDGQS